MIGSGQFDPNLWYLLIHDGSIIGAALCYDYDDLGWIRQLGVAPAWRRRGLGTSLLQHSFREFYKRNRARIRARGQRRKPKCNRVIRAGRDEGFPPV